MFCISPYPLLPYFLDIANKCSGQHLLEAVLAEYGLDAISITSHQLLLIRRSREKFVVGDGGSNLACVLFYLGRDRISTRMPTLPQRLHGPVVSGSPLGCSGTARSMIFCLSFPIVAIPPSYSCCVRYGSQL